MSVAVAMLRRNLLSAVNHSRLLSSPPLHHRFISTTSSGTTTEASDADAAITPLPRPIKTKTPLEKQFETWVHKLKPGCFNPDDVDTALRAQSDPDLALDIFRWTALQRHYKHTDLTYLTMFNISASSHRYSHAETLLEEILAGACDVSVPLCNSLIRFCSVRKNLFKRAFDVYKKMLKSEDCKPDLETYTLLLNSLLRRFNKLNVCYVYLHAVKSLTKQMKSSGVMPDTYVLNMIIKAYSKCHELDAAIRVFHELGLYGCEPNAHTYSYLIKGFCEKGRLNQGHGYYKEMKRKGLVPTSSTYMILICSLSIERRFEDSIDVAFDMLSKDMVPDLLTYRTLLEGLCREGRGDEAFELIEELRKRDSSMGEKTYRKLLDELHFLSRE